MTSFRTAFLMPLGLEFGWAGLVKNRIGNDWHILSNAGLWMSIRIIHPN